MDDEIPSSRLRQRILRLPGVTERQNAGITKTASLSDAPSLSTSVVTVIPTFDWPWPIRREFWPKAKRVHTRWRRNNVRDLGDT